MQNHVLKVDAQVASLFNYTITRTPNDVVARIVAWYTRDKHQDGSDIIPRILDALRAPSDAMRKLAAQAIKAARQQGLFLEEMHVSKQHNLVPSIFRNALANTFAGNAVGTTFEFTHLALGDDSTAATNLDTTLGNEVLRAAFTDRAAADNVTSLDVFFAATEVGGNTYLEAGAFADPATGSPDTGYLGSRVVINEAMGVNETLTVNVTITVV